MKRLVAVLTTVLALLVGLVVIAPGGSARACETRYYSPNDAELVLARAGVHWRARGSDALVAIDWCPELANPRVYSDAQIAGIREHLLGEIEAGIGTDDVELGTAPAGTTVVDVPTWLWLDAADLSGASMQARSGVLPVRVELPTAELELSDVAFDVGDGSSVSCADGGVPYDPDTPYDDQDTECSHVYERPSEDGDYEVHARATVTRPYTCKIAIDPGRSLSCGDGELESPIEIGPVSLRVAEVQALVTGVGR